MSRYTYDAILNKNEGLYDTETNDEITRKQQANFSSSKVCQHFGDFYGINYELGVGGNHYAFMIPYH